jgi:valine dehydrogenase (NAD+)
MTGVFDVIGSHEQVVFCNDPDSGLRAIIAVFTTGLGPSLGGTRWRPYPDSDAALADALALSRAMAYKAACAGLDIGGGKAVIIGDPAAVRPDLLATETLLRAFGRFVDSLGGRYITACDVGTYVSDMDLIARESRWVTGRSLAHGGSGDSGVLTAFGVFQGLRACAAHVWGEPSLAGRRVAVAGLGKVGRRLVGHLLTDGATVLAGDVSSAAVDATRADYGDALTIVAEPDELLTAEVDVYSPNALGGVLTAAAAAAMPARIVCGGANNQLAEPAVADALAGAGVLYAPDFVVNAGGLIQLADEASGAGSGGPGGPGGSGGYSEARARAAVARIFDTTARVIGDAAAAGSTTEQAAEHFARRRMTAVGRLRGIRGPSL